MRLLPKLQQYFTMSLRSRFRVHNTFNISLALCVLGFIAHFSFIFLFLHWGVPSLAYFNILSAFLWAWAVIEVLRGYTYRSVYLGSTEILLHAATSMYVLGQGSGFDLYLWPLAAWLAYNPNINHRFALLAGAGSIILWVFGRIYWNHDAEILINPDKLSSMFRVNATIAGGIFVFGIVSARTLVEMHSDQLKELAGRDVLTGLYNRRYVTEFINQCEKENQPDRRSFALILTDIDHFKSINDQYGHEIGDKVLKEFSLLLQSHFRKEDMVCRWGGEEFLIILPKCSLEKATAKADDCRRQVADLPFVNIDNPIQITASFGVVIKNSAGEYFDALVSRADKLLYKAKASGRNRVFAE